MAIFYLSCTSVIRGAIGIFHVYGEEEELALLLDARVGGKKRREKFIPLQNNELRYGWLFPDAGPALDEVMLGRIDAGMRVLMTHGGDSMHAAVRAFLEGNGAADLEAADPSIRNSCVKKDLLYQPLLAGCVTESQVAALLAGDAVAGAGILATRRMLLCGAPNVGKSSLFNQLCGWERAFVYDRAGATADVVDELVDLGGYAVWVGDMPGFGGGDAAWELARRKIALADLPVFVCDGAAGWTEADAAAANEIRALGGGDAVRIVVLNKADLGCAVTGEPWRAYFPSARAVSVSSLPEGNAKEVFDRTVYELLG